MSRIGKYIEKESGSVVARDWRNRVVVNNQVNEQGNFRINEIICMILL